MTLQGAELIISLQNPNGYHLYLMFARGADVNGDVGKLEVERHRNALMASISSRLPDVMHNSELEFPSILQTKIFVK